jgi:phage-related protein
VETGFRWRSYRTASGAEPVSRFLSKLRREDRHTILDSLETLRRRGLSDARHLRGDIYEVRVIRKRCSFRVLLAQEAGQIMLLLVAFRKTSQKAPRHHIELAEDRLRDWRSRGGSHV